MFSIKIPALPELALLTVICCVPLEILSIEAVLAPCAEIKIDFQRLLPGTCNLSELHASFGFDSENALHPGSPDIKLSLLPQEIENRTEEHVA